MENLENTLAALKDVKTISYGCCTIEAEVHEDSLDAGGAERHWIITCTSYYDESIRGYGVDTIISVNIDDDGVLLVEESGIGVYGKYISEEHKEAINIKIWVLLHQVQPNTTQYVEELLWGIVTFIERGLDE